MLCGQNGSIDLTEWFDSPEEGPVGPAVIECSNPTNNTTNSICSFQEKNMDSLISQLLGDSYISLSCESSSCIQNTQLPTTPADPNSLSYGLPLFALSLIVALLFYLRLKKTSNPPNSPSLQRPLPVSLDISFIDVGVKLQSRDILKNVTGIAQSGRLLAVLGLSGSGKSTFLRIIAGRSVHNHSGDVIINDSKVIGTEFRDNIG